ncbi:YkgJ family cysteine cluster protein [Halopiger xanaduensis]|uniref:YkgJ family cysteine cluster protein n=1 Tax=Halopiger xanaduensis (strain DSM 18323 / JCM 14033 / SH-6) TaxID=797210 RepID=F8D3D6_HALXS|nr:hypothetical protein [Halopiger xanaduensis]AEH36162.1 hypothetical protein Halxa_1530 [Halopiger xanaduensis SH-6]
MEVHCEGCAGCCMDWRPLTDGDDASGGRRRAALDDDDDATREAIDGDPNFVPLTRDEVRAFLEHGMAAALTPRFWKAADEAEAVEIDGYEVASVADRPVFFVGLRKPPKPVAPFGRKDETWLPTCVFLDPTTLQCRIHNGELYPAECGAYPTHNLALEQETECERVEAAFGGEGDRLVDESVPDDLEGLLLGSQAIGQKLFCHPVPERLEGIVDRVATGDLTREDRAECLGVAAASSAGTVAISDYHYERGKERALEAMATDETDDAESWVGPAIREWERRREAATAADDDSDDGTDVPPASVARTVEDDRGAPETPGWDALES